ncbi:MAG: hypothetical protein ACOCX1_04490 [Fimbriimonadaceae bacterium]
MLKQNWKLGLSLGALAVMAALPGAATAQDEAGEVEVEVAAAAEEVVRAQAAERAQPMTAEALVQRYQELMERLTNPGVDKDAVLVNVAALEEWGDLTMRLMMLAQAGATENRGEEGAANLQEQLEQAQVRYVEIRERLRPEQEMIGVRVQDLQEMNEFMVSLFNMGMRSQMAQDAPRRDVPREPMREVPMMRPMMGAGEPEVVQDDDFIFMVRSGQLLKIDKNPFDLVGTIDLPMGPTRAAASQREGLNPDVMRRMPGPMMGGVDLLQDDRYVYVMQGAMMMKVSKMAFEIEGQIELPFGPRGVFPGSMAPRPERIDEPARVEAGERP